MSLTLVPPRQGYSKNFRLRGTIRKIKVDETTGTADRKAAEAIRIKREAEILDQSIFGSRASCQFTDAAIAYIEVKKPRGTQRDAVIGRVRKKDGSLSPCLISDFGNVPIANIDQALVDRVAARFAGRKPGTLQRGFLTPLIAVLNFSAKRKWCDRPMLERPKFDDRRSRWATYAEADAVLAAASPHIRRIALFLMLSGARLAEALELEWADVNLQDRWLVFRGTKRGSGPDSPGEDRGVGIHPQLAAMLAGLPVPKDGKRQGPVFRTHRGKPYADNDRLTGGQMKTGWLAALRRAEIQDLRVHDLRHTCSTWLIHLGVSERVVDEIMGHSSTRMGRRYSHVPREDVSAAIDKLPPRGIGLVETAQEAVA